VLKAYVRASVGREGEAVSGRATSSRCDAVTVVLESDKALESRAELDRDADFVVLKSDQRKSKTGVAVKPELERNVVDAVESRGSFKTDVGRLFANHLVVSELFLRGLRKLIPNLEPRSEVSVDALSTDLDLYVVNESVSDRVSVRDLVVVSRSRSGVVEVVELEGGKLNLKVDLVDKVTVTRDRASDFLSEVSLAGEDLLDRLFGEVSRTAVYYLPVGDLGVTCKVNRYVL